MDETPAEHVVGRRAAWASPRAGVVAMVVVLLIGSAVAWWLDLTGIDRAPLSPHLPWWALAPLFAVAEVVVVHVQVRREAQAVSLSEIPMVLALYVATPSDMLLAAVLGAGAVYVGYRRQSAVKAVFNTTLRVFGVTVALVVFHTVGSAVGATSADPVTWIGAICGVAVAGAADGLLVLAVVSLHEGTVDRHEAGTALFRYPLISALVACVGVLTVLSLHTDPHSVPLLVVTGTATLLAYRAHASLTDRHVSLAQLYDFGRAVTGAHLADEILASALSGARDLLRADAAEVVLLAAEPGELPRRWLLAPGSDRVRSDDVHDTAHPALWHSVLVTGTPLLHTPSGPVRPDGADPDQLAALGYREAVVVALRDDTRVLGTLMVAERMGEVRTFQPDDIATLETIANQAGLALAKERLLDRMQHEAMHDVLTGLANRTKFRDAVQQCLGEVAAGTRSRFAVLLIDLDGFKEVNDSLGHHHGDALLVHVAEALVGASRPPATVARLGGDEFAILLPTADVEQAVEVASRVHEALARPVVIEDIEVQVQASIGIALAPAHACDVSGLLRVADAAMYVAKAENRGTKVHDDSAPDRTAADPALHTKLALLADLRKALVSGDLDIEVQPQANATTGEVFGVEALVRWNHPVLGTLLPAEFLGLADRHGLMHDLTALVLDRSLAAAAQWRASGLDLGMSVNLSARSLMDERTLPMVRELLAARRIPPGRLTLEITEDSVISDPDTAIALLLQLRAVGVRLSVDDFGTGYSSLSYLRRLPVDEVKIDRSFIAHLSHDTHDLLIARSIIDLGNNLSLDVVVEGVEDEETWNHLAEAGCHAIQGYHLARPMPVPVLAPWLRGYNSSRRTAPRTPSAPPSAPPSMAPSGLPPAPRDPLRRGPVSRSGS